ncbi:MAG: tripartite tricarboxylate transporter substrate binding protein [Rhizobiales bacterium]|nr:tripartite tricarboxylate transporter substrate binding protein [Hyphomicrobiales bacterium]
MLIDRRLVLAGLGALAITPDASAQSFPNQPIRLVVPFAPAGGTDIAARLLGEHLATALGQNVVIDNRPGANGVIAGEAVKTAPADGHTLLVATAASFAGAPALGQKLPYDVEKDFRPVGMLGLFPLVLNVAPSLPVNSLAEFIALAKKEPGKMNFASAGVGGTNHLVFELLAQAAGIKLQHVPYRGAALAATDLMSGQVHAMIDSLAASLGNIQAQKVKALALTTSSRQPQLPNLTTMKEQGVDLVYPGWASFVAPAGTPPAVIDTLNGAMAKALAAPALKQRYEQLSIEPVNWSPAETGRFMAADRTMLTDLVKKTGIKVE